MENVGEGCPLVVEPVEEVILHGLECLLDRDVGGEVDAGHHDVDERTNHGVHTLDVDVPPIGEVSK